MTPEPVTLDEATAAKLAAAKGHVIPLCGPCGEVIAYAVPPSKFQMMESAYRSRIAELDRIWPPEEIARIKERRLNDPQPSIPHEEVMRRLGLLDDDPPHIVDGISSD